MNVRKGQRFKRGTGRTVQGLGGRFLGDLLEHWKEEGWQAIRTVYEKDPATYLKIVVAAIPKQIEVKSEITVMLENMSDAELDAEIKRLLAASASGLTFDGEAEEAKGELH